MAVAGVSVETVANALRHVPSDCDRDLWIRIGMACKAELGDSGFAVWDAWSQEADSYEGKDAAAAWKSFDQGGGVTIATLLFEAKKGGFSLNGISQRVASSAEEVERHRHEREAAQNLAAAERANLEEKARLAADGIWKACVPCTSHPYLKEKAIQPHGASVYAGDLEIAGKRCKGALVITLRNAQGRIDSLQFILPDGEKRYLPGGRKSGNYFAIGTPKEARTSGAIVVAEGFATAASIYEATGIPSVAAFDAGNLPAVALAIRAKFLDLRLIVAADNDRFTLCQRHKDEGAAIAPEIESRPEWCRCNPGITSALKAISGVAGQLAVPCFADDDPQEATDFNDLARLYGKEAVVEQIAEAQNLEDKQPPAAEPAAVDDRSAPDSRDEPPSDHESIWPAPLDLEALSQREPEKPQFIIQDWGPAGYAWLFAGHGGVGKSGIALHLAVCMAAGRPFFGVEVEQRRVMYLSCEDRENILHWRLSRICSYLGLDLATLRGSLEILDLVDFDSLLWERNPKDGTTLCVPYFELSKRVRDRKTEVVFVDGVSDTFGGSENSKTEVKRFVRSLVRLVPADRGGVLLVGHIAKPTAAAGGRATEGYSGTTGWHNCVRARWYLYPETSGDSDGDEQRTGALILELQKSNLGPVSKSMRFAWDDESHIFVGQLVSESTFDRKHRDREEQAAVVRALQACAGKTIVPASISGPRNAYSVLTACAEFPGTLRGGAVDKRRFRAHLEALRQAGKVKDVPYVRGDRHKSMQLICGNAGNA